MSDDRLFELLERYRDLLASGVTPTPDGLGLDAATFEEVARRHRRSLAVERRLAPVRVPDPQPGVVTGRYRTTQLLGRGGNGDVFRADDRELTRAVALKVPRVARAASPDVNARLQSEAVLMGRLDHPGIPAVHSLGTDAAGRPFYTMRLIDGGTLADAIDCLHLGLPKKQSARGFGDALRPLLRRLVAVCAVVGYAHSKGVLHRDLKPHNVMIGAFDETLVMDWGLARVVGDTPDGVPAALVPGGHTVGVVGTVGYIAPEVWAGATADRRADVYGLGAVLYHLLAGRPSLSLAEVGGTVRPVAARKPNVPAALAAVCGKAMHPDPAARYQTADALATDVQAWLDDRPVTAHREPWVDRTARWTRRHRTAVSIATTALPLLLALGVGAWLANGILGDAETRRATAVSEKTSAEQAAATALNEEKAAKDRERKSALETYFATLNTVDGLIDRGEFDEANRRLDEQKAVMDGYGEPVGFEWGHRKAQADTPPPVEFQHVHTGKVLALSHPDAFAPLLSAGEDGRLVRWDADTGRAKAVIALDLGQTVGTTGFNYGLAGGQRRVTFVFPGMPADLAIPPVEVGDLMLAAGPDEQHLTPLDGLTEEQFRALIGGPAGAAVCYRFAKPDGTGRRAVTFTRVRGAQAFTASRDGVARFSRDGKRLAIGLQRDMPDGTFAYPVVVVFDTTTGNRVCEIPVPAKVAGMQVSAVSFSPDASELVVAFNHEQGLPREAAVRAARKYRIYDAASGREKAALGWGGDDTMVSEGYGGAAFGPDGKRVYVLGGGATNGSLGYWPADKRGERPVTVADDTDAPALKSTLEVSEDGRWVLVFGFDGAAVLTTGGGESRALTDLRGAVYAAAVAPNGRLVAAAGVNSRLGVYATDGTAARRLDLLDRVTPTALAFTPDSRRVYVAQRQQIARYDLTGAGGDVRCDTFSRINRVTAAAVHPSGELLLASKVDVAFNPGTSVTRHDPHAGRLRSQLVRHPLIFNPLFTAPTPTADGSRVAAILSGFMDDVPQVLVFDTKTAAVLHRCRLPPEMAEADSLVWLPGETGLLVGLNDAASATRLVRRIGLGFPRQAVRCDLTSGKVDPLTLTASGVESLAVSPDGKSLIAADRTAVFVRDPVTFALRYRVRVDAGPVTALSVSPDGKRCAVAFGADVSRASVPGADSRVAVFDLFGGATLLPPVALNDGGVSSTTLAFTPDGKELVCGTTRGNVHRLDATTGRVTGTFRPTADPRASVSGLFVSAAEVAVSTVIMYLPPDQLDQQAKGARFARFSLATGKPVADPPIGNAVPKVWAANADRTRVTVADLWGGPVRVYDPTDWAKPVSTLDSPRPKAENFPPFVALAVSADGNRVAGACAGGAVLVVSHPDGNEVRRWTPKDTGVEPAAVRFTPDGSAVVVAGRAADGDEKVIGRVVRLTVADGKVTRVLDTAPLADSAAGENGAVLVPGCFALSDDAATLVVPLADEPRDVLAAYSLATGKETARHPLGKTEANAVAYHTPTGTAFALTGNRLDETPGSGEEPLASWVRELVVWKVGETDARHLEVEASRQVPFSRLQTLGGFSYQLTLSPDGRRVAHRDWLTGTVRVTDVATGTSLLTKPSHYSFGPLLFTPDGRTLLNAGDGAVLYTSVPPK